MICYDYINNYIRETIKPEEGFLKELGEYARQSAIPIIHPEVAALLKVLGMIHKPSRVLEAGTAIGYSAILLSSVIREGGVIDTVERDESMAVQARKNIKESGFGHAVNVIIGDAIEVFRCLDKSYDMIFLDAAKGQYPEMLPDCIRLLSKGGLLVSDNVLYKGMVAYDDLVVRRKKTIVTRMRDYLKSICTNEGLETSIIPIGDGVAISYKIR